MCVVGVGGVGSWAVEALARTGVGALTLVDFDEICISNVNRQLPAITGAFGKPKVAVLAERVHLIQPDCHVQPLPTQFMASTADALLGPYTQSAEPVIRNDGGHNCVFRGFDGQLYTSFHRPNKAPDERVRIERLDYIDGRWVTGEFGA